MAPSLTLYYAKGTRSSRVQFLLEELNLQYSLESETLETIKEQPYLSLHPLGKLPVLQDGDITILESGAVIQYILFQYGDKRLQPESSNRAEQAAFLQWMWFAEATLAQATSSFYHKKKETGGNQEACTELRASVDNIMEVLDKALEGKTYILGNDFTAADIMLAHPLSLMVASGENLKGSNVTSYFQRLQERPAWKKSYGGKKM